MIAEQVWNDFCEKEGIEGAAYEAWAFGGDPDELANLVMAGEKTATCSLGYWYEEGGERLPQAGDYSVILNANDEAVCVIQTVKVTVMPFNQVPESVALKEGEGDKSYAYWRNGHIKFFGEELKSVNKTFREDMNVVCEEFELRYTAS